ncbi:bacteriohemerythrin [Thermodesulfobacteriota bacterium]
MTQIKWNEQFSVGIKEIDDQHKTFIKMINKLVASEWSMSKKETVADVLNEMLQYASLHFETEERYMRNNAYPEYEAHKQQHEFFKKETFELIAKVTEEKVDPINELYDFLSTWLTGHIIGSDAKYAPYLSQDGSKP